MRFHARHVSASSHGDYYQVMFAEHDNDDLEGAYLIIQRQFEDAEDETCYIETHDPECRGHFLVRLVDFKPGRLSIEIVRASENLINVTFDMTRSEFRRVSQVLKIISGEVESEPELWIRCSPRRNVGYLGYSGGSRLEKIRLFVANCSPLPRAQSWVLAGFES